MSSERDGRDDEDDRNEPPTVPGSGAGEDDGGVAVDGKDNHLKDDQKPTNR